MKDMKNIPNEIRSPQGLQSLMNNNSSSKNTDLKLISLERQIETQQNEIEKQIAEMKKENL